MPKAKPLPDDPKERERVLQRRKATVEKVARWKKRHPNTHRIISKHCVRRWRAKTAMKAELKCGT